ncbi:MAG TPA: flavodoxin [Clostridia bacterium]|jgi:flavodoxin I
MAKILIVFWSGTGNTEKMAELIAQGAKNSGATVDIRNVALASPELIDNFDAVALGSPAMGVEVIEEDEMEPFVESIKDKVSGKKLALFGSYDWGDGEWMESWKERMTDYGALVLDTLIVHLAPEGDSEQECINLGAKLASL